jgi:hypothetical protein
MNWYVLEWNALDDRIDLYEWPSEETDISQVWEEVGESLHNCANVLVMDNDRLRNLFQAVNAFQNEHKGGKQDNG